MDLNSTALLLRQIWVCGFHSAQITHFHVRCSAVYILVPCKYTRVALLCVATYQQLANAICSDFRLHYAMVTMPGDRAKHLAVKPTPATARNFP